MKKRIIALATSVGIALSAVMSFVASAPAEAAEPYSPSNPVTSLPFDVVFASHTGEEDPFTEEEYAVYMANMAHWWIASTQGFLGVLPLPIAPTAASLKSGSTTPKRMYVNSYGPFQWTAYADVWHIKSDQPVSQYGSPLLENDAMQQTKKVYDASTGRRLLVVRLDDQYASSTVDGVTRAGGAKGFPGYGTIAVSTTNVEILTHEVGHTFGLKHLTGMDCQGKSDGRMLGAVGSAADCTEALTMGNIMINARAGIGLNGFQRIFMGLVSDGSGLATVKRYSDSGQYLLSGVDAPSNEGVQVVRIADSRVAPYSEYTVEYTGSERCAVNVMRVRPTTVSETQSTSFWSAAVDSSLGGSGSYDSFTPTLGCLNRGETFRSWSGNVVITVLDVSAGRSTATVQVDYQQVLDQGEQVTPPGAGSPARSVNLPGPVTVALGGTARVPVSLSPADTLDTSLSWTSSNPAVATVSTLGTSTNPASVWVTGKAIGTATLTAKTASNLSASVEVRVVNTAFTSLELGTSSWDIPSSAGDWTEVSVWSNVLWSASSNSPWLTVDPQNSSGDGTLKLSAAPNTGETFRAATVTVTTTSGMPQLTRTIKVSQGINDPCGSSPSSSCNWSNLDSPVSEAINVDHDQDWYKIVPNVSGTWVFAASKPATSQLGSLGGELYGADGTTQVAVDYTYPEWFRLSAVLAKGETYYLQVGYYSSGTGNYTVTATAPTSLTLELGSYSWMVPSAKTESTSVLLVSNDSWTAESTAEWLTVTPEAGTGDGRLALSVTANPDTDLRWAFVRVTTTSGTPTTRTIYVTQPADLCGESVSSHCTWSDLGSPLNGTIEARGDKDCYKITPAASGTWMFTSSKPAVSPLANPYGTIYQSDGVTIVAQDDDGAGDSQFRILATLTAGQTYYLEVKATATGSFTVTASLPAANTDNELVVDMSSWAVPSSLTEYAAVLLESNTLWKVESDAEWLKVSQADGAINSTLWLSTMANSGPTRSATVTVTTTAGSPEITRTITVTQPGDLCGSSTSSHCTWSDLSLPISGTIEARGDRDLYKITPTVSGIWVFTASKPEVSPLYDSFGALFDSDADTVLAFDYDSAGQYQFEMQVELTAGRTYYVDVRGMYGSTGNYIVTATAPKPAPENQLDLSTYAWAVPTASNGSTTVELTSNTSWSLTSSAEWLTVAPAAGAGNATVALSAAANTDTVARSATVTATTTSGTPEVTRTFTVSQPAAEANNLELGLSEWSVPSSATGPSSRTVSVTSNTSWSVSSDADWLTVTPDAGTGNKTLTLSVTANTGSVPRSATVTAKTTSGTPEITRTITVTQQVDRCGASLSWICTWSDLETPLNGTAEVVGDKDWYEITPTDTGTWVFASSRPASSPLFTAYGVLYQDDGKTRIATSFAASGQLTITAELTAGQTYYLEVWAPNGTGNYTVTATAPVTTKLKLSASTWQMPSVSYGSTTVTVESNEAWSVSLDDSSWMAVNLPSGSGNGTLLLSAMANFGAARSATVTVTTTSGVTQVTRTITVTQPAVNADNCGSSAASSCSWDDLATPLTGAIDTILDSDWFKITPNLTGTWVFTSSKPATAGLDQANGILYAASGGFVASNFRGAGDNQFKVQAILTAGQTYYLHVNGVFGSVGDFIVTATPPPENTLSLDASTWDVPSTAADSTWVSVESNTVWSVTPNASWLSTDLKTGSGNDLWKVMAEENTGAARSATVTVSTTSGSPPITRTITVTQPAATDDPVDFCGQSDKSFCDWLDPAVTGAIEFDGDKDWYKITPTTTGTWVIYSTRPRIGSLRDPYGTLYQSDGTIIAENDDGAGDRQFWMQVTLTAGQTYYLEVKSYGDFGTGEFRVTASHA